MHGLPSSLPLSQLFLPPGKQTPEVFDEHFTSEGLEPIVKLRRSLQIAEHKRVLKEDLVQLLADEEGPEELIATCQQHISDTGLTPVDVTIMVCVCVCVCVCALLTNTPSPCDLSSWLYSCGDA